MTAVHGAVYFFIREVGTATVSDVGQRVRAVQKTHSDPDEVCHELYRAGYLDRSAISMDNTWTYYPSDDPPAATIRKLRVVG